MINKIKNLFRNKKDTIKEIEYKGPSSQEICKIRDEAFERARNCSLPDHEIIAAINLKAGDEIIHKYARFKIQECGCGFGASNEFGNYFWIKGFFLNGNRADPKPLKDFWSFQECPVIKLK